MKDIEFTAATLSDVGNKIFIFVPLQETINNNIKLNDYISTINHLVFFFQCFPKDIKSRKVEEFKTLRRKTKTLELYLILDYEGIMQGTDPENLQHIKEVFVKGCETFLKPLKEFKWEEFNNQIQNILK